MDRRSIITFTIIVLMSTLTFISAYFYFSNNDRNKNITSFTDCKNAGYPILESYPAQCKTSDGTSFTQAIGNELDKVDQIVISTPRPNQKIELPLKLTGKARGNWFFEGRFPVKLIDEEGFIIAEGNAISLGEWMTDDFVSFQSTLTGDLSGKRKGMLILEKSNPSDLAENADQLEIPVTF